MKKFGYVFENGMGIENDIEKDLENMCKESDYDDLNYLKNVIELCKNKMKDIIEEEFDDEDKKDLIKFYL